MSAVAVADVLDGAADLIDRDGWVQGVYFSASGKRCADGAIMAAGRYAGWKVRAAARQTLVGTTGPYLVEWNDTPGRTKAEVVAALRAAAERARA